MADEPHVFALLSLHLKASKFQIKVNIILDIMSLKIYRTIGFNRVVFTIKFSFESFKQKMIYSQFE